MKNAKRETALSRVQKKKKKISKNNAKRNSTDAIVWTINTITSKYYFVSLT